MRTGCEKQPDDWTLLALLAITFTGLALRMTNVSESLWVDELHTGWVVKDRWEEVGPRARIGNQSPLWFYAVKVVTTLGGESELTLRLLSLVAGTALIPATYWLVRILGAKRDGGLAGLLAAALVAVDHNCIFYATEARPYAGLQLVAALQIGLFWQVLNEPDSRRRIAWMLLTALAFHLHYTGVLIVLGEWVFLVGYYTFSRSTVPYRPWRALFDWQIVVILCLPALPHVLEVGSRRGMWDQESPAWSDLAALFPLVGLACVLLAAIAGNALRRRSTTASPRTLLSLTFLALWFAMPLLVAFLAARFELAQVFSRRYLIALGIGPMLLTTLLLTRIPWRALQAIAAVGLVGYSLYDGQIIEQLRYDGRAVGDRDEDWRGAIAWLRAEYSAGAIKLESGIVEEVWGFDDPRNPKQLEAYLRFPIDSLYDLPNVVQPNEQKWFILRKHQPHFGTFNFGPSEDWEGLGWTGRKTRAFGDVSVFHWPRRRAATAPETTSPPSPTPSPSP